MELQNGSVQGWSLPSEVWVNFVCVCVYDDPSVFLKGVSAGVTCTVPEDIFASSERQWCFVQLYLGITLSLIEV